MTDDQITRDAAATPRRSRARMLMFGAALLLCGMIIGAGGMATVLWERFQHSIRDPKRMPERIMEGMQQRLQLSDAQAGQIRAIIERHRDEFEAIRAEMEPRIQAHMDQVNAEIRQVLTLDQQKQWQHHFARAQHRWSRPPGEWEGHGRPRGGPGRWPPPPGQFPEGAGE